MTSASGVVVMPDVKVATGEAYAALDRSRGKGAPDTGTNHLGIRLVRDAR